MSADAETGDADGGRSPESIDRAMVGGCAAIWLVLLVVSVIATVALVNLGRGQRGLPESSSGLLYAIIGISAATIVGAVYLLMRARRDAQPERVEEEPADVPKPPERPQSEARTEKIRVFGTVVDPSARPLPESPPAPSARAGALERIWLRGTASIAGAMGLALIGVASAAHQLAVGHPTAAVVALGIAGVVTLATPALLVIADRKLEGVVAEGANSGGGVAGS